MSQQPSRASTRSQPMHLWHVSHVWRLAQSLAAAAMFAVCAAASAQSPQGTPSMEERLRAQLRQTTEQLQQAKNELAALKAGGATVATPGKDSPDALRKQLDEARQLLAAERQSRERLAQDVRSSQSEFKAVADKANTQIAQYRNAYDELLKLARQADAQRKHLADETAAQRVALAMCKEKNDRLYAVGQEILTAYETMDVATIVAARQPFASQARVKYEQIAQQYGDKLYEGKFDEQQAAAAIANKSAAAQPDAVSAPASAPAPAATQ